jgi:CheY-like chemotaxis protein
MGSGTLHRRRLLVNFKTAIGYVVSAKVGEKDSKDLRVLLVEDVEDTRLFMRLELEQNGFIVFEADNGQAAVDLLARETFDVILMDLTLPLMDGFEAAKLIRQNDRLKNVPMIAVTAHQETDFRSDAKASGFDAYVTKPIDIKWLKELIAGLLA